MLCMLQGEHALDLAESQLNSLLDGVSDLEIFCTEMEDYADYLANSHLEMSRRLNVVQRNTSFDAPHGVMVKRNP